MDQTSERAPGFWAGEERATAAAATATAALAGLVALIVHGGSAAHWWSHGDAVLTIAC